MAAPKPLRPPVKLEYLLWDGTDPVDSQHLGNGLQDPFHWNNLLNDSPEKEEFVSAPAPKRPRVFQPCGSLGKNISPALWERGMFEFPRTFFDPDHHNAGGDRPHFLGFSGHGIPGFMFSESGVLICSSRPMVGPLAHPSFVADPKWNNPSTQVALFSACRQLQGRPQQFLWSKAMRGANPVHVILSYRNTAPAAARSASINDVFIANLFKGQAFVEAWNNAHTVGDLPQRWAALAYRSAVGDGLVDWTRTGKLASTPDAAKEDILYFDSENLGGRVVTEPKQFLDCLLSLRGSSDVIPFWFPFHPGTALDLHLKWTDASNSFEQDNEVWIAAVQVRPDYFGPFEITQLFTIDHPANPLASGTVTTDFKVHDPSFRRQFAGNDTYVFKIDRGKMPWLINKGGKDGFNELVIPIKLGTRFNPHFPIFYFMLRVEKPPLIPPAPGEGPGVIQEFGIPTVPNLLGGPRLVDQKHLVDDFQFAVFLLGT